MLRVKQLTVGGSSFQSKWVKPVGYNPSIPIMRRYQLMFIAIAGFLLAIFDLPAATASKFNRLSGPAKAQLEGRGQIDVPEGYVFFDGKTTRAMLKAGGEPTSGSELG